MQARVKEDYRWKMLNLFNRTEFIKGEWREVPAGFEKDAEVDERLEIRPTADQLLEEILEGEVPASEQVLEKILSGEGKKTEVNFEELAALGVTLNAQQQTRIEKLIADDNILAVQKLLLAEIKKQVKKQAKKDK